jgi:hypothetical protein
MDQLQKLKNPKAREFYQRAEEQIRSAGAGFVISHGMPEFAAWAQYFNRLGWCPFGMAVAMRDTTKQVTMPTQWPQWFDTDAA